MRFSPNVRSQSLNSSRRTNCGSDVGVLKRKGRGGWVIDKALTETRRRRISSNLLSLIFRASLAFHSRRGSDSICTTDIIKAAQEIGIRLRMSRGGQQC
jgi:hypothetical protein